MKCMNVTQCNSQRQKKKHKNQRTKNNGHKGKNNETQGPRKPRRDLIDTTRDKYTK